MARILAEIGWLVTVLDGGYKRYRRDVVDSIDEISSKLDVIVLQGPTGTAKTHILREVMASGQQAIDPAINSNTSFANVTQNSRVVTIVTPVGSKIKSH
mgnify:CR=1 FL=1